MNEYQALTIVSENNGKSIEVMLAAADKAGHKNHAENQERFLSLLEKGYIQGAFVLDRPVTLTIPGTDRLEKLQNEAKENAQKEADRRFNKQVAITQMLVSLASFILGIVVEHYAGLIALISELFR